MLRAAGFFEHTKPNFDPRAPKAPHTRPRNVRMGISVPDEYTADTRVYDRIRAWASAPRPAAGFERNRERCTAQALGPETALRVFERHDLGVGSAHRARRSATQQTIAAENCGTDRRVRMGAPGHPARCAECDLHRRIGCHSGCSIESKKLR
jgi:hypothetical protein